MARAVSNVLVFRMEEAFVLDRRIRRLDRLPRFPRVGQLQLSVEIMIGQDISDEAERDWRTIVTEVQDLPSIS